MIELNIKDVLAATGGRAYLGLNPVDIDNVDVRFANVGIKSITLDSRKAEDGSLFIAIAGERSDGHYYIPAIADRIAAAVVERLTDTPVLQILVPSTYAAVGAIGAYIRTKSGVKVVGVTGSVGKTSVKELTAGVLSQRYNVLKTEGNFNNELGLPQTLFRLEPGHEVAVLEMGISHFGEMSRLSAIARPDYAIFTNIENVHTENLIDRDGVLRAKTELVANMCGDLLILNGEDDKLSGYNLPNGKHAVYYGCTDRCSVTADDIVFSGIDYTTFTLKCEKGQTDIELPAAGRHMVLDALAAAACGLAFGLELDAIKQGLESYVPVGSRMRKLNRDGAVILDDCYNASPKSVEAGLKVLCSGSGRSIAVLGDMLELGENSKALHEHIGRLAAELGLDMLITVGNEAQYIANAAESCGLRSVYHTDIEGAAELLKRNIKSGDTVLIKASRGMALERVIALLMKEEDN